MRICSIVRCNPLKKVPQIKKITGIYRFITIEPVRVIIFASPYYCCIHTSDTLRLNQKYLNKLAALRQIEGKNAINIFRCTVKVKNSEISLKKKLVCFFVALNVLKLDLIALSSLIKKAVFVQAEDHGIPMPLSWEILGRVIRLIGLKEDRNCRNL